MKKQNNNEDFIKNINIYEKYIYLLFIVLVLLILLLFYFDFVFASAFDILLFYFLDCNIVAKSNLDYITP